MNKQLIVYLVIILPVSQYSFAQWTERDSVWLQRILDGQDTLLLNPETMNAIEKGFLLRQPNDKVELLEAAPLLPITKDFSDYLDMPDTVRQRMDTTYLPPAVLRLYYQIYHPHKDSIDTFSMGLGAMDFSDKNWKRIAKLPVYVAAGVRNVGDEAVKDGQQQRGGVVGSVRLDFSFNDILTWIFSKKERQKKKNKKRAAKLKHYNDIP